MFKLLILALLTLGCYFTQAQVSFNKTASNPTSAITNTSVDTLNYRLTTSAPLVTVQVQVTRLTGTMAGTSTLSNSVDGVTYVTAGTALTLTNAANNTQIWNISSAAKYWRIITGGATTVTGTVTAKISTAH